MVATPLNRAVILVLILARLTPFEARVLLRVRRAAVTAARDLRDLTTAHDLVGASIALNLRPLPLQAFVCLVHKVGDQRWNRTIDNNALTSFHRCNGYRDARCRSLLRNQPSQKVAQGMRIELITRGFGVRATAFAPCVLAVRVGVEPTTRRLTGACSTN